MRRRITIITLILAMVVSASASVFADSIATFNAPTKYELKNPDDSIHWIDGYSVTLSENASSAYKYYYEIEPISYLVLEGDNTSTISFELYQMKAEAESKIEYDQFIIYDGSEAGTHSNKLGIKLDKDSLARAKQGTYKATVKLTANSDSPTCVLEGADIMLADGSSKKVEDVQAGDAIRTFDFFTGEISSRAVLYNLPEKDKLANVIRVSLDNGKTLDVCDCQSFFDMDNLKYFDVNATTAKSSIGKNIMYIDGDKVSTAKITNVSTEYKKCNSYEIFTEYDMNFIANGVLTVEPGVWFDGLYTIDKDLKINQAQYQADVEQYGQYEYKDFEKYYCEDTFEKTRVADVKIAIGKGLITEEEFFAQCDEWVPQKKAAAQPKKTMLKSMKLASSAPPQINPGETVTTEIVVVITDSKTTPTDTSDSNNIALYCIGMLIAFAGITIALYKRRTN